MESKRLKKVKGKFVEELPNILWTYQITPQKATNEKPYALAVKFEIVIPLDIVLKTELNRPNTKPSLCYSVLPTN